MKHTLLSTTFLCLAVAIATPEALAQSSTAVGTGISGAESNSAAGAVAVNRGNGNSQSSLTVNNPANTTASINSNSTISGTTTQRLEQSGGTTNRIVSSGTTTVRTAPSMVAPGLAAAGLETCLGSASGTVSAIGFGIGGGSTYADEGCQARLDSRTLYAYGLKAAAVARLCQRIDIWRSMPDMCTQYWPPGVPYPAGVAAPITGGVAITMSTGADAPSSGVVRVIDGRDGIEKDCLNYSPKAQKCFHWLGEGPRNKRTQTATATAKPPKSKSADPTIEPPTR